jgi:putative sigma-54 modulation protein
MRKYKTRLLKSHRPRANESIRYVNEQVYKPDIPELEESAEEKEVEPVIVHKENYRIRPLYQDEAIMEMELSERSFIVFHNAKTEKLSILFRRADGDYGMIEP